MRKLIVKNFALSYSYKFLNKEYSSLRASRIIFPLFLLMGTVKVCDYSNGIENMSVLFTVSLALTVVSLYLGFFYFNSYPVKWGELDDDQKWQYGIFVKSLQTKNSYFVDWEEWERLDTKRLAK